MEEDLNLGFDYSKYSDEENLYWQKILVEFEAHLREKMQKDIKMMQQAVLRTRLAKEKLTPHEWTLYTIGEGCIGYPEGDLSLPRFASHLED